MLSALRLLPVLALFGCASAAQPTRTAMSDATPPTGQPAELKIVLVIHGGAGVITREGLTPEIEAQYRAELTRALQTGYAAIQQGKPSLDAVEAAIRVMEDSPLFNAGKGAVLTHEGTAELDASIMDGATLRAGAVAGVKRIQNPIALARLVMEKSPHVMLTGDGAEAFATEQGVALVDPAYFILEKRRLQLKKMQDDEAAGGGHSSLGIEFQERGYSVPDERKWGTVGAVALDHDGHLAAGTSTGGMMNKRFGRVGDSPIIGAGTYADSLCGVSATGHGEFFIRAGVARDIAARMAYLHQSVGDAARDVVMGKLVQMHGDGGVIALDREGHAAMPFNTPGMYRGTIDADGHVTVGIFRE